MPLRIAIGSGLGTRQIPRVLIAEVDALDYAFHTGDEDVKEACRDVVRGIYREKDTMCRKLEASDAEWRLAVAEVDGVGHLQRTDRVSPDREVHWVRRENCILAGKQCVRSWDMEVMAVTPAGVRLLPWLAEVTRGHIG